MSEEMLYYELHVPSRGGLCGPMDVMVARARPVSIVEKKIIILIQILCDRIKYVEDSNIEIDMTTIFQHIN